jgi:hypothetical protein
MKKGLRALNNIMGVCFQRIIGKGPPMDKPHELTLATDWVWVVIRRDGDSDPAEWHLQGVASDKEMAEQMCEDESYIIGPVPLNTVLPHSRIEWIGSYFPLRTDDDPTTV